MKSKILLFFFLFVLTCYAFPEKKRLAPPHPRLLKALKGTYLQAAPFNPKYPKNPRQAPFREKGNPASGTHNILVVPFAFSDRDIGSINNSLLDKFKDYYSKVSHGKFNVDFIVAPKVTSSHEYLYYSADKAGIDSSSDHEIYELAREAVDLLKAKNFDFSSHDLDQDRDGILDHLMIIHAGNAQEFTGQSTDIWSHMWSIINGLDDESFPDDSDKDGEVVNDKLKALTYTLFSNNSPLGIMVHEFGHDLELVDLYDIDGSSSGIGNWGLMSTGCWNGPDYDGSSPSFLCAYNRYYLGWANVEDISDLSGIFSLNYVEGSEDKIYKIKLTDSEYFLLENRTKTGYDSYLPGEGLLIWHIDESVLSSGWSKNKVNDNDSHRGIDLEEADGGGLDTYGNRGDSGDPFPGTKNNTSFTPKTTPASTSYYVDVPSFVNIRNISYSDNIVSFFKEGSFGYYVGIFSHPEDEKFLYITVKPTQAVDNNKVSLEITEDSNKTDKSAVLLRDNIFFATYEIISDSFSSLRIKITGEVSNKEKVAEIDFDSKGVKEVFVAPARF